MEELCVAAPPFLQRLSPKGSMYLYSSYLSLKGVPI